MIALEYFLLPPIEITCNMCRGLKVVTMGNVTDKCGWCNGTGKALLFL